MNPQKFSRLQRDFWHGGCARVAQYSGEWLPNLCEQLQKHSISYLTFYPWRQAQELLGLASANSHFLGSFRVYNRKHWERADKSAQESPRAAVSWLFSRMLYPLSTAPGTGFPLEPMAVILASFFWFFFCAHYMANKFRCLAFEVLGNFRIVQHNSSS